MAAPTVTCHLMGPPIILRTEPLLTVLMALAGDLDLAEALAEDLDLAEEEDGGKFSD
jgi:hypothetical protein